LELLPLSWDQFTRDVALTQLQTENMIIDSLFESIRRFKEQNNSGASYLEGITARTEFI